MSKILLALTLLAAWLPGGAEAQSFGRFFTTPEERAALDAGERRGAGPRDAAAHAPQPPPAAYITLKGVVYREQQAPGAGGANSQAAGRTGVAVWVDDARARQAPGRPAYLSPEGARIDADQVTFSLPATGQTLKLKPGQTYQTRTGAVFDAADAIPRR